MGLGASCRHSRLACPCLVIWAGARQRAWAVTDTSSHAGCEHLRNDHGVIVDFNTADPLIRWDSYESLSACGEGTSGRRRLGLGGLGKAACSWSAWRPETLPSFGAQRPPTGAVSLGEPVRSRLGEFGWRIWHSRAGPAPWSSLGRNACLHVAKDRFPSSSPASRSCGGAPSVGSPGSLGRGCWSC